MGVSSDISGSLVFLGAFFLLLTRRLLAATFGCEPAGGLGAFANEGESSRELELADGS